LNLIHFLNNEVNKNQFHSFLFLFIIFCNKNSNQYKYFY